MSERALKRINKELADISGNPPENAHIDVDPADNFSWNVVFTGPADSCYAGGKFMATMKFPDNYPFKAPEVTFVTKVYHPNISKTTGEICADVFVNSWSPTLNARYVIEALCSMFMNPNADSPVEPEIAAQLTNNPAEFEATVRQWVQQYAT